MGFNYLSLVIIFNGILFVSGENEDTLVLANVLYRHGDRTPIRPFPTDQNQEDTWTEGLGQLTKIGIQQEYALGRFLQARYDDFLNEDYKLNEIYVMSTDTPRTLMSAQSVLCGLYPPSDEQRWNDSIAWQPIPVHTVPVEIDHLFSKAPCERMWKIGNATIPANEKYITNKYGDILPDLYEKAGYKGGDIPYNDFDNWAGHMMDALRIEKLKGRPFPAWINETLFEERLLGMLRVDLDFTQYETLERKRLKGGALLEKMATDMRLKKDGFLPDQKMFMYSGHDTTLMPLLSIMVQSQNFSVPYSSTLMLELHREAINEEEGGDSGNEAAAKVKREADEETEGGANTEEGGKSEEKEEGQAPRYFVQLWLRTDPEQGAKQLKITGCSALDCDFFEFLNSTRIYRVKDRFVECQVGLFGFDYIYEYASYQTLAIIACVLAGLVLLLVLVLCVLFCKNCCTCRCTRRRPPRKYHVHEKAIPERVPMINTAFSDED